MDETVATAYDRLNAGDVDDVVALFADDAVFVIPGTWGSYCVKRNGTGCLRRPRSRPRGTPRELPWAGETEAY